MDQTSDERLAIAKIFAEQAPEVQQVIKAVLAVERRRLHLRRMEKQTVEQLVDAVRSVFE